MKRILKNVPAPHIVICDTNILWHDDKVHVASPDFEKFWSEDNQDFNLSLHIPDTVYGELLFQHFTSCQKIIKSVVDNLFKLSSFTTKQHNSSATSEKIYEQLENKFNKWVRTHSAKIIPLPTSNINWTQLASDAIWRKPPFIFDAKNPEVEKGFRDALILETVCDFVSKEKHNVNIVLLCNDKVLRDTVVSRLKGNSRFTTYETIKEFQSYLSLTREKLTNEFIANILSRARTKFFSQEDSSGVWYKYDVKSKIKEEFSVYFENVGFSDKNPAGDLFSSEKNASWLPVNSGKFWIPAPEFVKIEDEKIYVWKTAVTYIQLFKMKSSDTSNLPFIPFYSALFLPFNITWSAMVKNDARFYDLKLISINMSNNEFRIPSEDENKRYHLIPKQSPESTFFEF